MKGLKYQLKSVLRDKFCLMTFLLPILVAVALNFMGSIEMSSPGELHFGVLENGASLKTAISGDGLDISSRRRLRSRHTMNSGRRRHKYKSRHWNARTFQKACKAFSSPLF